MTPNDLELVSTQELIDELVRRTTFMGVVVHSKDEAKDPAWDGERVFRVYHSRNLHAHEARRLLDVVSGHMAGGV